MMAGVLGPPDGPTPEPRPEMQRLYFDVISRVADPSAANGSPLVYQWRFSDADPWHLIIDNGSTRAEPGEAPNPTVTFETSWADWVASRQARRQPAEDAAAAPHPPARQASASWRGMRKVFR